VVVPALLPGLLMLLVGRVGAGNPALGWDENATYLVSQRTIGEILRQAGNLDGVIAPYYLFMHGWTAVFGTSELALRTPSLLTVALGVALTGELGRRLFGPGVGLLAGLMLVAVPQLSRYAQDARAYGFVFLFAVLASLLLHRTTRRPGWGPWIGYAAAVTLLGLAHIVALLLLVGHGFLLLARGRWRPDPALRRWLTVTTLAVLPVLPLVALGLTQRGDQLDWIKPVGWQALAAAPGDVFLSAAAGLLIIGLAITARWPDRPLLVGLWVTALTPPAALLAVSLVTAPLWVPRYVLFVLAPLAMLAAVALRGMPLRAAATLGLLIAVAIPAHLTARGPNSHHGPNFRAIAGVIAARQQPGDGIVYARAGNWSLRAGVGYYLRGTTAPRDLLLWRPAAQVGRLGATECPDTAGCLGTTTRVWVVRMGQTDTPAAGVGPAATPLRERYRQIGTWKVSKGTVGLFERR
jgi:mannosyltransferase